MAARMALNAALSVSIAVWGSMVDSASFTSSALLPPVKAPFPVALAAALALHLDAEADDALSGNWLSPTDTKLVTKSYPVSLRNADELR